MQNINQTTIFCIIVCLCLVALLVYNQFTIKELINVKLADPLKDFNKVNIIVDPKQCFSCKGFIDEDTEGLCIVLFANESFGIKYAFIDKQINTLFINNSLYKIRNVKDATMNICYPMKDCPNKDQFPNIKTESSLFSVFSLEKLSLADGLNKLEKRYQDFHIVGLKMS
jgi:hypothetical protein